MVLETIIPQLAPYLQWSFLDNTGGQYADAVAIFVFSTTVFWLFRNIVLAGMHRLAKKTSTVYDDLVVEFIQSVKPPLYLVLSLFLAGKYLNLHSTLDKGLEYAAAFGILYYVVKGLNAIITHVKEIYVKKEQKTEDVVDTSMPDTLEAIAHLLVWIGALLLVLGNLGVDITAIIAGLGIGGLAVAIAAQSVLGDVFAAFSIYFDKPFKKGDFIIIGSDMGVVKHIGIKTTRIQALGGQELVVSNKELTESRVNNYKRMEKRRVVFAFG
ncbi:MAG: mechanosensitive ion channel, partial [Candidatus Micrarchaeota archaeon]|nr:mechanosensitive ion channel [Candidatus Micrarchaeota archaeon]